MLEKYRFLSTEWLLFGKGKMYRDQPMQDLFEESIKPVVNNVISENPVKPDATEPGKMPERADMELIRRSAVERIVWFFADKTFSEYLPGYETDKKS
jgi:hypothetical protein